MLNITINNQSIEEKKYIIDRIFTSFLGVDYKINFDNSISDINISRDGKEFKVSSQFFKMIDEKGWLSIETLPKLPLEVFRTSKLPKRLSLDSNIEIPIIYGTGKVHLSDNSIDVGIDIFGSCFYMLSRYEEVVCKTKDHHGRFPFKESIAFKESFVSRPIVDEYVELLWGWMSYLWPELKRVRKESKVVVSCDVDFLRDKGAYFPGVFKRLVGDLVKRKSFNSFLKSLKTFYIVGVKGMLKHDPFNTFDFMMDECEKNNLKMSFYFIPRNNKTKIDGDYDIESDRVIKLMKNIIDRGHEVGFHGSYNSYNDKEKFLDEVALLKKVYKRAGGDPNDIKGGRQHYLRWQTGITEKNWEAAGMKYDSTLGYAEHVGFRCGTSQEYEFYDCVNRKALSFKVKPLLIMEGSLLQKKYMNLSSIEAYSHIADIKRKVHAFGGSFTVLWHNSYLGSKLNKDLFSRVIKSN